MNRQKKINKSLLKRITPFLVVLCMMCGFMLPMASVTVYAATPASYATTSTNAIDVNAANGTNYPLFNSGLNTSSQRSRNGNYDESSFTNSGYDLTSNNSSSSPTSQHRMRLGLSFYMNINTEELSTVTIYAYDIDENGNPDDFTHKERDYVFLVDETLNEEYKLDGYMSGLNNSWSTTSFDVDDEFLILGHTYHFEFETTCICGQDCGWWSYVRTVNLIIDGSTEPPVVPTTGIENADLSASISSSGLVSVDLTANAYAAETYTLEYKAVCAADNAQYGGKEYSVTIPTTSTELDTTFQLESGAPKGTYKITVFIKDATGTVITTRTATASYGYSAVSYNSNGGSQNLPTDGTTYSSGDTVTVKFDYVPSLYGRAFLGWSTDRNATEPMYTANRTNTFVIGSSDVTLYAVWGAFNICEHEWSETTHTDATCTTDGLIVNTCSLCGEAQRSETPALGHDYVNGACSRCGAVLHGNMLLIISIVCIFILIIAII